MILRSESPTILKARATNPRERSSTKSSAKQKINWLTAWALNTPGFPSITPMPHYGHLPRPDFAGPSPGRPHKANSAWQTLAVVCLNLHHPTYGGRTLCHGGYFAMNEGDAHSDSAAAARRRNSRCLECPSRKKPIGTCDLNRPSGSSKRHGAGRWMKPPGRPFGSTCSCPLPIADPELLRSGSLACGKQRGAARIAGAMGFNMLFSHLRTPEQYRQYSATYPALLVARAASRPIDPFSIARTDATAFRCAEPALRTLWRRFQAEEKIAADMEEPEAARLTSVPTPSISSSAAREPSRWPCGGCIRNRPSTSRIWKCAGRDCPKSTFTIA